MRVAFFILNIFDYDSRARLICADILRTGWQLDIIATTGGQMENFGGATIHRLPQPTFPFRQRRFVEFNVRAFKLAKELNADIYHAVDLDTLWAAAKAAKATGGRLIYESREFYTGLLSLKGRPLVRAFWQMVEKTLIKQADAVITINGAIAAELAKLYGIQLPEVVMNTAPLENCRQAADLRREFSLGTKFVLVYQGVLRPGQGLFRSLAAIKQIPHAGLVLLGDGPLRAALECEVSRLGLTDRVRFAGLVLPQHLSMYTRGADAGLLLLEPLAKNNILALPQKLFQYIAAGVPPIVTNLPCLKQVVEQDNLGLVLDASTTSSDAFLISDLLENRREAAAARCRQAAMKYNWQIESQKLLAVYRKLIA